MLDIKTVHVPQAIVNEVYEKNEVTLNEIAPVNSYMILRNSFNEKHSAIVQHAGAGVWKRINSNDALTVSGLRGKDSRQVAMINNFINPDILVNVVVGTAGTGKTTLALAYALDRWFQDQKRIVLCKPTSMVGNGNAFGPVPGDMDEKYAPYLASYEIAIKRLLGGNSTHQLELMKKKGHLEYVPIELVRGSEFAGCTFIFDEAQNSTWHELKTLISRMGDGTKMLMLGDLHQIDTDMDAEDTGLYKLITSPPYQESPVSSQIELLTQYRSPITQLVADVDKWVTDERKRKSRTED